VRLATCTCTKNVEAVERCKRLVEQNYKKPVNTTDSLMAVPKRCRLKFTWKTKVMTRTNTLSQNSLKLSFRNVSLEIIFASSLIHFSFAIAKLKCQENFL